MKEESPFREVRIAADYLKNIASLLQLELKHFCFEEFDKLDDGTYRIGFSYDGEDSSYGYKKEKIRKTLYVKDDEITAVREGTLAAQDINKHE